MRNYRNRRGRIVWQGDKSYEQKGTRLPLYSMLFLLFTAGIVVTLVLTLQESSSPPPLPVVNTTTTTTNAPTTTDTPTTTSTTTTTTDTPTITTTDTPTTTPTPTFALACIPSYQGELEEINTDFLNAYAIVGSGCNSSMIDVDVIINGSSTWDRRRYERNTFPVPRSDTLVNVDYAVIECANRTVIEGPLPNATTLDFELEWITSPSRKRDIGVFAMSRVEFLNVFGVTSPPITSPDDELYGSFDGDDVWKASIASQGSISLIVYQADPLAFFDVVSLDSIFSPQCITASFYVPRLLRFDYEAGRFVIVMLKEDNLCVGVSDSNDPMGGWQVDVFSDPSFAYNRSLEFAIWGDYYNVCWMDPIDEHQCALLDRSDLLSNETMPQIALLNVNISGVGEIGLLNQGNSARGNLMTGDAPCGVFGVLNSDAQTVDFLLCTGLNFSEPLTFMTKSIAITGGWTPGTGTLGTMEKNSLSTRIRFAYHAYDTYDRIAYAFTENVPTTASLLVGDFTDAQLLAETASTPEVVPTVFPGMDIYAPAVHLDCRETLFLAFKLVSSTAESSFVSYRLKTDPSLRIPLNTGDANDIVDTASGLCVIVPNTVGDRRVVALHVGNKGFRLADFRLQNQNFNIYYNASDACSVLTCDQQVTLGTVAACSNVI